MCLISGRIFNNWSSSLLSSSSSCLLSLEVKSELLAVGVLLVLAYSSRLLRKRGSSRVNDVVRVVRVFKRMCLVGCCDVKQATPCMLDIMLMLMLMFMTMIMTMLILIMFRINAQQKVVVYNTTIELQQDVVGR